MNNVTVTQAYEMIFRNYPDVIGVKEVSSMLGMCSKKVYELIHNGKLLAIPCGKKFKVAKLSVIEYLLTDTAA